jgi:hypothetical protein
VEISDVLRRQLFRSQQDCLRLSGDRLIGWTDIFSLFSSLFVESPTKTLLLGGMTGQSSTRNGSSESQDKTERIVVG